MKNMKKAKKLLAFLCAVVVCMSSFTACTDSGDKKNNTAQEVSAEEITELCFSVQSGFYDEPFTLEIYHPDADAKIYYTTDGSTPDETDTLYTGGIELDDPSGNPNVLSAITGISAGGDYIPDENVDKANVIRAVAVLPDGTVSEIINGTFFVGIDREEKYGDAPVISLLTDKENLFDYEKGIYVLGKTYDEWLEDHGNNSSVPGWQRDGNYSNKGREWERPVNVEYITSDGSEGFCQDMGVRIMGGASRNACQKSLRLIARDEYGKKNVKYEVIPDNEKSDGSSNVEKYKSFVLRCGGNDYDYAKIRDSLLQQLVSSRRFETEQYTPAVVFIDGEYWGSYMLIEDYTDNYIQNNYDGIDNENVIIYKNGEIEEGTDEDKELFSEMYEFITMKDMSVDENYQKACEMLDMGSFMDYIVFNLFIGNQDGFFQSNNWQMWRVREADGLSEVSDGKWRMLAHDTDYSTGIYNDGTNYSQNSISDAMNKKNSYPGKLFTSLMENEEFKKEFVRVLCDMRNVDFEPETVSAQIEELRELYEIHAVSTYERFGPEWIASKDVQEYYNTEVSQLETYLTGRYSTFLKLAKISLDLGEICEVKISTEDSDLGTVKVNTTELCLSEEFVGNYFDDYGITVTAQPAEGAEFVRWECEGCEISDENSPEAEITLTGDCTIKAVFE